MSSSLLTPFLLSGLQTVAMALGVLLALCSIGYLVVALRAVARWQPGQGGEATKHDFRPPVTVMVPAYGAPPGLYDCLATLCRQDYGDYQIVVGLHAPDDPARAVVEQLIADFPQREIALVIDARMIGANPKNCNLANAWRAVRHDMIVMVDSDIRVEPGFLARVVAPLADATIGGVTCLYRAAAQGNRGAANLASVLGALAINDWFIPSAIVDTSRREMDICYGAAIAVTRRSLTAIGGFEAMASAVAQDFVFGQRLTQHGFRVVLADTVVETIAAEPDLATLFRHELRWNRAVRACRPRDHALSLFMQSLPLEAALLLLLAPTLLGGVLVGVHVALRLALHRLVRQRIPIPGPSRWWLVVPREALCFAVWLTSYFTQQVRWGRMKLQVGRNLDMSRLDQRRPQ